MIKTSSHVKIRNNDTSNLNGVPDLTFITEFIFYSVPNWITPVSLKKHMENIQF